jgi:hypothetical protein
MVSISKSAPKTTPHRLAIGIKQPHPKLIRHVIREIMNGGYRRSVRIISVTLRPCYGITIAHFPAVWVYFDVMINQAN